MTQFFLEGLLLWHAMDAEPICVALIMEQLTDGTTSVATVGARVFGKENALVANAIRLSHVSFRAFVMQRPEFRVEESVLLLSKGKQERRRPNEQQQPPATSPNQWKKNVSLLFVENSSAESTILGPLEVACLRILRWLRRSKLFMAAFAHLCSHAQNLSSSKHLQELQFCPQQGKSRKPQSLRMATEKSKVRWLCGGEEEGEERGDWSS